MLLPRPAYEDSVEPYHYSLQLGDLKESIIYSPGGKLETSGACLSKRCNLRQSCSRLHAAEHKAGGRGRGCRPDRKPGSQTLVLFFCPRRDVSNPTPVFHHCPLQPCGLSGQIAVEVTVASRPSVIFPTGLSHYTDTKDA
ncbi:hypothetical protein EYF80_020897 [Liparis tanakae]|uniref:Uncharacterized protein n=1 Tax=Liparis tanakae TaxID=230148 RepID=A0A4Z2HVC7_9TELE|nr:hypothetical protein EYF80_020897 [Liparis tanakae]